VLRFYYEASLMPLLAALIRWNASSYNQLYFHDIRALDGFAAHRGRRTLCTPGVDCVSGGAEISTIASAGCLCWKWTEKSCRYRLLTDTACPECRHFDSTTTECHDLACETSAMFGFLIADFDKMVLLLLRPEGPLEVHVALAKTNNCRNDSMRKLCR
jgi:hypothetical protein